MPQPHKMEQVSEGRVAVTLDCFVCEKTSTLYMTPEQYAKYAGGERQIQVYLADMPASDRELLLSRTCGECYAEIVRIFESDEEE